MAKEETYKKLFENIVGAVKRKIADDGVAKMVERSNVAILQKYHELKTLTKNVYMANPTDHIDRHKCGACFMVAFMKNLLILPDQEKYEEYREELAILAGLTVMGTFIMGNSVLIENAGIIAFLKRHEGFKIPDSLCENVPYVKYWALELREACNSGRLSILTLANELFLIERYNREYLLTVGSCGSPR